MTTVSNRSAAIFAILGGSLVAAFFMPWVDVLGFGQASGYDIATHGDIFARTTLLFLAPLAGAALAFTALADRSAARTAALAAGVVVIGPTVYYLGKGMLFGTSWGLWMVIAGSLWLMALAAVNKVDQMPIPALLIVAGFFLPWTTNFNADFASWGLTGFDIARAPSLPFDLGLPSHKVAYIVPLAGTIGLLASLARGKAARTIGGISGFVAVGWIAYFIGRSFSFFTGWGLWLTIGAGALALVLSARKG